MGHDSIRMFQFAANATLSLGDIFVENISLYFLVFSSAGEMEIYKENHNSHFRREKKCLLTVFELLSVNCTLSYYHSALPDQVVDPGPCCLCEFLFLHRK